MHCNSPIFSHFQTSQSTQDDFICLVLTEFPEKTNLQLTKSLIQDEFTFINKIHVRNCSEIQCYFESMTDLIEIDQGRKYGAGRAFIRRFEQCPQQIDMEDEFQKPHGVFQNSSQTFESETQNIFPSYKYIPSVLNGSGENTKFNPRLLHHPTIERLTSLENEIQELEHIRKHLELFKDEIDWQKTGITQFVQEDSIEEWTKNQADQNQSLKFDSKDRDNEICNSNIQSEERSEQREEKSRGKEIMHSLIEGAALTGILIGGFKLLKNFIG